MLARKVLDLAEKQGLLDAKAIIELRRAVEESKFIVTPEAIAKVLVDHGHLTPYQARKLVNEALGPEPAPPPPPPRRHEPEVELTLAEEEGSKKPPVEEEEIVELEPVQPAPKPKPAPPAKKPAALPVQPGRPKARPVSPAVTSGEELVPLQPVPRSPKPSPAIPAHVPVKNLAAELQPLTPLAPLSPLPELTPLTSLEDLTADPLAPPAPAPRAANPLVPQPLVPRRVAKNVWDSPFLLIGGGAFGVILVIFGILLYTLTFGTATELFNKTEEDYRSGAYARAIEGYNKFLDRYPADPNASLARVRRAMAQLRQVSDDGRNPRLALQTAQQLLPQIETEPRFGEARTELATVLPDVADGVATLAGLARETAKREELVKLAAAAMELVNNPVYLPASLRKEREQRITKVVDKLNAAERSIQQDKELVATIEKIKQAVTAGKADEAYRFRDNLVRIYPPAESDRELQKVTLAIGEKEKELVLVTQPNTTAATDDPVAGSSPKVVGPREGPPVDAGKPQPAFVLVAGGVYGMDVAGGKVLWGRNVGLESTAQPLALPDQDSSDAIILDGRSRELIRLRGLSGDLVWRQPLGEAAADPVLAGAQIVVSTKSGRVLQIDAASGTIVRAAQLPQGALLSAAVESREGRSQRLLQLGSHSTLFVLAADSLACTETVYLGHKMGAIFVPPAAILGQVLVCESPADDYTLIRVLSPEAKTGRLIELTKFRLKGRVVTPLAVSRNRVAAVSDLAQIAVYEIDPTNAKQPVRLVVGAEATETSPLPAYYTMEGNRLWLASKWRKLVELQPAVQQFSHKWTEDRDDSFVAPLQLHGQTLLYVRRRPGGGAALVEACNAASGKTLWTTPLAAPVAPAAAASVGKLLTAPERS